MIPPTPSYRLMLRSRRTAKRFDKIAECRHALSDYDDDGGIHPSPYARCFAEFGNNRAAVAHSERQPSTKHGTVLASVFAPAD